MTGALRAGNRPLLSRIFSYIYTYLTGEGNRGVYRIIAAFHGSCCHCTRPSPSRYLGAHCSAPEASEMRDTSRSDVSVQTSNRCGSEKRTEKVPKKGCYDDGSWSRKAKRKLSSVSTAVSSGIIPRNPPTTRHPEETAQGL